MIRKRDLDRLYRKYNRRDLVDPDPLALVYKYRNLRDREIVGLIASSLAYGRVVQIMKSVTQVLDGMGQSPFKFLFESSPGKIRARFKGFKHRFTTGEELASLLVGMKRVLLTHGSLNRSFLVGLDRADKNVLSALTRFVDELDCESNYFIPSPLRGSACKRLNLYLRWMVRRDDVDPGGWKGVSPKALIVPLDTHMRSIATELGLTKRKTPNMKMALEITEAFKDVEPEDPVKYDFALTRFGIHPDLAKKALFSDLNK